MAGGVQGEGSFEVFGFAGGDEGVGDDALEVGIHGGIADFVGIGDDGLGIPGKVVFVDVHAVAVGLGLGDVAVGEIPEGGKEGDQEQGGDPGVDFYSSFREMDAVFPGVVVGLGVFFGKDLLEFIWGLGVDDGGAEVVFVEDIDPILDQMAEGISLLNYGENQGFVFFELVPGGAVYGQGVGEDAQQEGDVEGLGVEDVAGIEAGAVASGGVGEEFADAEKEQVFFQGGTFLELGEGVVEGAFAVGEGHMGFV